MFFGLLVSHSSLSDAGHASASTPASTAADFPARAATSAYPTPRRALLGDGAPAIRIAVRSASAPRRDRSGAC